MFEDTITREDPLSIETHILQVTGWIAAENDPEAMTKIKQIVWDWLQTEINSPISEEMITDDEFSLSTDHVPYLDICSLRGDGTLSWVVKLRQLERYHFWTTEFEAYRYADGLIRVGMNIFCEYGYDIAAQPPARVPTFMTRLARNFYFESDGFMLMHGLKQIEQEAEAELAVMLIKHPKRVLPVTVVTLPAGKTGEIDAIVDVQELGMRLDFLSHVYFLHPAQESAFNKRMGEWGIVKGGIRTYRPDFNSERDTPSRHPLITAETLLNWSYGNDTGARGYIDHLFNQAAAISTQGDAERRMGRLGDVRGAIPLDKRIGTLGLASKQKIQTLNEEIQQVWAELVSADEKHSALEQQVEGLRSERNDLLQTIGKLKKKTNSGGESSIITLWREAGSRLVQPLPRSYDVMKDWVDEHLADRLVVLPRALNAAKKADYEDPTLVYQSLLLLACEYRDQFINGGPEARARFDARRAELRMDIGKSFSDTPGIRTDAYNVTYGNKSHTLDWHLKRGNSRDTKHCLRVYFFFDEETKRPVVGHLPSHLDNKLT